MTRGYLGVGTCYGDQKSPLAVEMENQVGYYPANKGTGFLRLPSLVWLPSSGGDLQLQSLNPIHRLIQFASIPPVLWIFP